MVSPCASFVAGAVAPVAIAPVDVFRLRSEHE